MEYLGEREALVEQEFLNEQGRSVGTGRDGDSSAVITPRGRSQREKASELQIDRQIEDMAQQMNKFKTHYRGVTCLICMATLNIAQYTGDVPHAKWVVCGNIKDARHFLTQMIALLMRTISINFCLPEQLFTMHMPTCASPTSQPHLPSYAVPPKSPVAYHSFPCVHLLCRI